MLYDKRWEKKVAGDEGISPEIFSLDGLIAWLEKQPADEIYCYTSPDGCLLAKYFSACGLVNPLVSRNRVCTEYKFSTDRSFPEDMWRLAKDGKHTFGAALSRARKIAEAR